MKITKTLSVTALALSVLAGCSGGGAPTAGGSKDTGGKSSGPVTLTFYDWFDEEAYMKEIIKAFEDKNPDIKIKANFVPNQEYAQKVLVNLSTGEGMDVFGTSTPGGMAEYAAKSTLLPLDGEDKDLASIQDLTNQFKINDKIYGYPYRSSSWVLYYNKDIFDKAGVPYPDKTWTWEKYAAVAKQLTSGSGQNKVYGSLSYQSTSAWWRAPGNTAKANNPNKPEDLQEFMKAAKFSYDLTYQDGAQQPYSELVGQAGADYSGRFLQGKAAMMYTGDWAVEMLNRAIQDKGVKLNYDIAPLPYWEGKEPETTGAVALALVNSKTKYPDQSKKFAKFIASEEAGKIMAARGLLPAWTTAPVKAAFVEKLKQPQHADAFFERKIFSQVPTDPLYNKAQKILTDEVSLYLLKEKTYEATLAKIQERIKNEVK